MIWIVVAVVAACFLVALLCDDGRSSYGCLRCAQKHRGDDGEAPGPEA